VFTGPSGLPVGIQLIGHRNQDHRLLEGGQAVSGVLEINMTSTAVLDELFRITHRARQKT